MTIEFKDLTLREGAQVPGLEITDDAGRAVLDSLAGLGVDCVEIAFPRANPREEWYRYADDLGLRTAALARSVGADADAALAVEPDEVEVIINSSDVQLEHALDKSREEALSLLVENVERVVETGTAAGATLMDAVRADDDFLRRCARAVVDAGGSHVTLADTTGSGSPAEVSETVGAVVDEVPDLDVSIHTHDDMGVASANALAGVDAGATRADVTVCGVGERAGNAPLEELAVLLEEKADGAGIDVEELVPTCRAIAAALEVDVPPDKPVVGERVYRHESGLHTAAMLREPATYEPFDPTRYGADRELLFGPGTGRGAVRALLRDEGVESTDERVDEALSAIRERAERKGRPLSLREAHEVVR